MSVFPVWLWVFIACAVLMTGFVTAVIWFTDRDEKLSDYDRETETLFERMWQLRHPGWLTTRLRLQLAALHALIPAVQVLHHQYPLISPAAHGPHLAAGDAPGPVNYTRRDGAQPAVPAPGPGALVTHEDTWLWQGRADPAAYPEATTPEEMACEIAAERVHGPLDYAHAEPLADVLAAMDSAS